MSWIVFLVLLILVLLLAILGLYRRRHELGEIAAKVSDLKEAKTRGSHKARLQYPNIDLSRCLGCGTCVEACPEDGVLGLIHGQAAVIHGARCVGHGLCAKECPVGAISVTLGDISERRDIPAISHRLEAKGRPGLFLAGEITGYALIRTAIAHGTAIAEEVAKRVQQSTASSGNVLDLCIVGAGPAGIACSLGAKKHRLRFLTLEQECLGGTVSKYPRRKLVMTQPVSLPLHGRLKKTDYSKEELMEEWRGIVQCHSLPIKTGIEFVGLERTADGIYRVKTKTGEYLAKNVCLALGRRGTPAKLGVPGEDLPKVAYSLLDAHSYRGRKILVVGGGDSAVEAALGLAEQEGNQVSLSYRKTAFFRLKSRNEARLHQAVSGNRIRVYFESAVKQITAQTVELENVGNHSPAVSLANDEVFIFAGGTPPFQVLEQSGVSFNPADREKPVTVVEQGTGLMKSLLAALACTGLILGWSFFYRDYYRQDDIGRIHSIYHEILKPSGTLGLCLGIAGTFLVLTNLFYLLRRSRLGRAIPGSLQGWMTSHVLTGILAFLFILVHAAMAPRDTVGGHAFWALGFLVLTGAIGRYFYSFVPRAANGKELALEDVQSQLANLSGEWDRLGRGFGEKMRREIQQLVAAGQWKATFFQRLLSLIQNQKNLQVTLRRLREQARREGLPEDQIHSLSALAKKAHRTALMAAHFEDLRAIMSSWRYFHRWVALLMVLLAGYHIVSAVRFGGLFR